MTFMEQHRKPLPPDPFPGWLPPGFKPVLADASLPHQIRLVYWNGGEVAVRCNCQQPGDEVLGARAIQDIPDAWALYLSHLDALGITPGSGV